MSPSRSCRSSSIALALCKIAVSGFVIISFVAYVIHDHLVKTDNPTDLDSIASLALAQKKPFIGIPQNELPKAVPTNPLSTNERDDQQAALPTETAIPASHIKTDYFSGLA